MNKQLSYFFFNCSILSSTALFSASRSFREFEFNNKGTFGIDQVISFWENSCLACSMTVSASWSVSCLYTSCTATSHALWRIECSSRIVSSSASKSALDCFFYKIMQDTRHGLLRTPLALQLFLFLI